MFFSPTDEQVETLLGCKVKSWSANLNPLTTQAFDRASKCVNPFFATLLILGLFICAVALAFIAGKYFPKYHCGEHHVSYRRCRSSISDK